MSLTRYHLTIVTAWFVALLAVFSARLVMGVPGTFVQNVALFLLGCIPAVFLVSVFRGAPRTIAHVLYETDRTPAGPADSRQS